MRFLLALLFGINIFAFCEDVISQNDRELLEDLFKFLVCEEGFGYVVFGSKPVAISGLNTSHQARTSLYLGALKNHRIEQAWRVWEKYANHFSMPISYVYRRILPILLFLGLS